MKNYNFWPLVIMLIAFAIGRHIIPNDTASVAGFYIIEILLLTVGLLTSKDAISKQSKRWLSLFFMSLAVTFFYNIIFEVLMLKNNYHGSNTLIGVSSFNLLSATILLFAKPVKVDDDVDYALDPFERDLLNEAVWNLFHQPFTFTLKWDLEEGNFIRKEISSNFHLLEYFKGENWHFEASTICDSKVNIFPTVSFADDEEMIKLGKEYCIITSNKNSLSARADELLKKALKIKKELDDFVLVRNIEDEVLEDSAISDDLLMSQNIVYENTVAELEAIELTFTVETRMYPKDAFELWTKRNF